MSIAKIKMMIMIKLTSFCGSKLIETLFDFKFLHLKII